MTTTHGFVGARFGTYLVLSAIRGRRHWSYELLDTQTDQIRRVQGPELVRIARKVKADGGEITIVHGQSWRDEEKDG